MSISSTKSYNTSGAHYRNYSLRDRQTSTHLQEGIAVQHLPDQGGDLGPRSENVTHFWVYDHVKMALSVALAHISESVVFIGQGLQRLSQHDPTAHIHRQLALKRS